MDVFQGKMKTKKSDPKRGFDGRWPASSKQAKRALSRNVADSGR